MLFILTIASLRKDWKRTPLFSIQKKYNYQSLEIDEPIIFEDFLVEVSVISCIFQDLRQGCIMISSYDYYSDLSVDYSTFNSCSNPGKAGSIYKYDYGECYITRCCVYNSSARWGSFAYVHSYRLNRQEIIDSSICFCQSINGEYAIYMVQGDQILEKLNFSNNQCQRNTLIYTDWTQQTQYNDGTYPNLMQYTSIRSNQADTYTLITISNELNYRIIYSNIIENSQNSNLYAMIESLCSLEIWHCTILANRAPQLISISFSFDNCQIYNTTIEKEVIQNLNRHFDIVRWKPIQGSFINAIIGTDNGLCRGSWDSYGTLTVPTKPPTTNRYLGFYNFFLRDVTTIEYVIFYIFIIGFLILTFAAFILHIVHISKYGKNESSDDS